MTRRRNVTICIIENISYIRNEKIRLEKIIKWNFKAKPHIIFREIIIMIYLSFEDVTLVNFSNSYLNLQIKRNGLIWKNVNGVWRLLM